VCLQVGARRPYNVYLSFNAACVNIKKTGKRGYRYNAVAMKHILSISYDKPLLVTRQFVLEKAGYRVSSAFGFAEALELCSKCDDFDLVLMGHSMPQKDKMALLAILRPKCTAPLLSIRRHDEEPLREADYSVDAFDGPLVLMDAVKLALDNPHK
jgi:CheY-like chemotaxis protein